MVVNSAQTTPSYHTSLLFCCGENTKQCMVLPFFDIRKGRCNNELVLNFCSSTIRSWRLGNANSASPRDGYAPTCHIGGGRKHSRGLVLSLSSVLFIKSMPNMRYLYVQLKIGHRTVGPLQALTLRKSVAGCTVLVVP